MHFSLSKDLTPLDRYLHTLRESGYPMVTTLLERGRIDMSGRLPFDWHALRAALHTTITDDDTRLLDLLAAGKSTPTIAKLLGQHRSRIWRRSQALKQRGSGTDDGDGAA